MPKAIGIDAGGTLTKVAYLDQHNELVLTTFPSNDLQSVKNGLSTIQILRILVLRGTYRAIT